MSHRWNSSLDAICGGSDKRGPRVQSTGAAEERCREREEGPGAVARGRGRRRERDGPWAATEIGSQASRVP
jgi:hypothetical protein